ncbi:hypothetical protein [Sedimenticola sp.]|uniref:hypothetical protein n=1 Tax=Sedimenticola sp. TaxID=1940285 RepID=UPI003D0A444A
MSKDKQTPAVDKSRRAFLETAGKAAAVAPAAALLLATSTQTAKAQVADPYATTPPILR